MFFMNYSGLENTSIKMLKYAMDLQHVEGTMYASTKEKVEKGIDNLEKSLEIMKGFLEAHKDDNTKGGCARRTAIDYDELDKRYVTKEQFNKLDKKVDELDKKVDDVLDKLGQLLDKSVSVVSDAVDTVKSVVVPDEYDPKFASTAESKPYIDLPDTATKSEKHKKAKDLRKLMRKNHELINNVPEEIGAATGFKEMVECTELIKHWFNCRFHPSNYPCKGFNAGNIYNYTQQIIGAYAYYLNQGPIAKKDFINEFKTWCDEIKSGKLNPYVLPSVVADIKYTPDWFKQHGMFSGKNGDAVTLMYAMCGAMVRYSDSYGEFSDCYADRYSHNRKRLIDLIDYDIYDNIDNAYDQDEFFKFIVKGRKFSKNLEAFKTEGQAYFTQIAGNESSSQADDRYNIPEMLDQEVCFA